MGYKSSADAIEISKKAEAYDDGLRSHMISVYNLMASGMLVTALVGWFLNASGYGAQMDPETGQLTVTALHWIAMIAVLGVVFAMSFGVHRWSKTTLYALFWTATALFGFTTSVWFEVYTNESLLQVFFVTAAMFGSLSLWGYTTKKDLSAMGMICFVGLIGLIIAMVVNIFIASSMMTFIISVIGVMVFSGLIAWDTQRTKQEYYQYADDPVYREKLVVMAALNLYLDFLNLMSFLLQIFGSRDD